MQGCQTNAVGPCEHTKYITDEYCHPYLRTNFNSPTPACTDEACFETCQPCNTCCVPDGKMCFGSKSQHDNPITTAKDIKQDQHTHCVSHSCALGKIICCADCNQKNCKGDQSIMKAEDISGITTDSIYKNETDKVTERERPCCAKRTSWTEPRICRCDPSDPIGTKRCECECGAAIIKAPSNKKEKKTVRFADEVVTPEDRDRAFRNLGASDVKELCSCCKECALKGEKQSVGKPVLVYELPEPKLEDTSVTKKDFCWQETPRKEIPPWHPNIKDRWHHLDVPSLAETTYQSDFKPPDVVYTDRKPVYLAPQRSMSDPCQELSKEYSSWKKTSTGDKHTYHSSCETCDEDLHRVHLHECETAHLPPQYMCHGDGHLCEPSKNDQRGKFTICEVGDTNQSKYWWKRTCCVPEKRELEKNSDLHPELMKSACPPYTTSYKFDFKNPKSQVNEQRNRKYCSACEYCTKPAYEEPIGLLCTKDTNRAFITQNAGII